MNEQTDQQSTDIDILSLCVTWAWHTVEMFMFGRDGGVEELHAPSAPPPNAQNSHPNKICLKV